MKKKYRKRNPEIIAQPPSALRVIALSIGIELHEAREIVRALAKAGFIVAPMEPTNSMFGAYMEALNRPATSHETIIRNVGKARLRWKAMAKAGLAVAFSKQELDEPLAVSRASGTGDAVMSNQEPGCRNDAPQSIQGRSSAGKSYQEAGWGIPAGSPPVAQPG
jgi:hypothetical protein